jgi:hypothetical protein
MEQEIITIIEMALTIFAAFIAWLQHRNALSAERRTDQVVRYFDPADETVTAAPDTLPGRSWKMDEGTKRWLTFDHPAVEQESLLRQVAEAEEKKEGTYTITVPSGWYEIEYGLIKGSGKAGSR